MLTRAQIQRLAQRNHIGMQVQERDYLQHLLLSLLYARSQALIFKGGTALRLVYRGNRYSEDLDFNGPDDIDTLRHLWRDVVADLKDFGIQAEVRNEWESEAGYSLDVSYQGPLYDGRDRGKSKVRVDINRRLEPVETRHELVTSVRRCATLCGDGADAGALDGRESTRPASAWQAPRPVRRLVAIEPRRVA